MKLLCTLIVLPLLLLCPFRADAGGVAAVQSINIKPYNDALKGFKDECRCDVEQFIISDMKGLDIAKEIQGTRPEVIIAIGTDALNRVKSIKNIPLVYLMILSPDSLAAVQDNLIGVSMYIPPQKQLSSLIRVLPEIKKIGILYDPKNSGKFVKEAELAAGKAGITIIAKEVRSPKEVPLLMEAMKSEIQIFWMLPDVTVITPETVEYLFLFSIQNSIPVVTFSDKFLGMGAIISLDIDAEDIGRQAGEMVEKILSGTDVRQVPAASARKVIVTINMRAAKKLGISINDKALDNVRIINKE